MKIMKIIVFNREYITTEERNPLIVFRTNPISQKLEYAAVAFQSLLHIYLKTSRRKKKEKYTYFTSFSEK